MAKTKSKSRNKGKQKRKAVPLTKAAHKAVSLTKAARGTITIPIEFHLVKNGDLPERAGYYLVYTGGRGYKPGTKAVRADGGAKGIRVGQFKRHPKTHKTSFSEIVKAWAHMPDDQELKKVA